MACKMWVQDAELTDKDVCFQRKEEQPDGFTMGHFKMQDGFNVYARYNYGPMSFTFTLLDPASVPVGQFTTTSMGDKLEFAPCDPATVDAWWK